MTREKKKATATEPRSVPELSPAEADYQRWMEEIELEGDGEEKDAPGDVAESTSGPAVR